MNDIVYAIDADVRRRASICYYLNGEGFLAKPHEGLACLLRAVLRSGCHQSKQWLPPFLWVQRELHSLPGRRACQRASAFRQGICWALPMPSSGEWGRAMPVVISPCCHPAFFLKR